MSKIPEMSDNPTLPYWMAKRKEAFETDMKGIISYTQGMEKKILEQKETMVVLRKEKRELQKMKEMLRNWLNDEPKNKAGPN